MARTALNKTTLQNAYNHTGASLTFQATDAVNGNEFAASGRDLIIVRNDDAAEQTITVKGSDDPYNRSEDIVKAIATGEYANFPMLPTVGYMQIDGKIYIDVTDADLKVVILEVNNN